MLSVRIVPVGGHSTTGEVTLPAPVWVLTWGMSTNPQQFFLALTHQNNRKISQEGLLPSFHHILWAELYLPKFVCWEVPTPIPQNVTVCGDKCLKEVIQLKRGSLVRP